MVDDAQTGASAILTLPLDEMRLLRLHIAEAFERARDRLLQRFAEELLARELRTTPPDIEALAQRALAEFAEEEIMSLRVSEQDAPHVRLPIPVCGDPALESGDLILQVRDGCLASPLRLRLERVLAEVAEEMETE